MLKEKLNTKALSINFQLHQVQVNGKLVLLTKKEYDLLALLANEPNKVFRKNEIFDKIWGPKSSINDMALTAHIRKLRKKIEFDSKNPEYILTVWKIGYKFKV